MAVAYQLVTDQTNFLLIHERAEKDKATDMPDLHKVQHMLPAGWGGYGVVVKACVDKIDVMQHTAVSSPSFYGTPPVLRCSRSAVLSSETISRYDIPSFLRKRIDRTDHDNPRNWSKSDSYAGLTPLGLSEWLRINSRDEWPKTYFDLRQIGLGSWVTDWLELIMANHDGKMLPEKTVIEAFLYVMSQHDIHDSLEQSRGLLQSTKHIILQLKRMFTGSSSANHPDIHVPLVEKMVVDLYGMTAETWPDRVFLMEAVRECVSNDAEATAVA